MLGSSAGLWVQPSRTGPVALIGEEGVIRSDDAMGARLQAVSEVGAWCLPDSDSPGGKTVRTVVLLRPDGSRATLTFDRGVSALRSDREGVYARVEYTEDTSTPDPSPRRQHWIKVPNPSAMQNKKHYLVDELFVRKYPKVPNRWVNGTLAVGSPWHAPPHPSNPGVLCAGLRWALGSEQRYLPRLRALVTGHDPASNREIHHFDLGVGEVLAAAPVEPYIWIALRRAPRASQRNNQSVELLRLDTRTGHLETLVAPNSIDITQQCWPVQRQPDEVDTYVEYQRQRFAALDSYWKDSHDGQPHPLVPGMYAFRSELVGNWPETHLRMSFFHECYPGIRLVKTEPLFDELGRPTPPAHPDIELWEGFNTGQWPPASEAIQATLYL